MAKTLEEWLNSEEVKELQDLPQRVLFEEKFFRNPLRPIYYKSDVLYSPADGILLYIGKYEPDEAILEVKGRNLTIQDLLMWPIDCACYVASIYLTTYSVHVERSPMTGWIKKIDKLPPLVTANLSMCLLEHSLLTKGKLNADGIKYCFKNERTVTEIYNSRNGITALVVSIADRDVNCILDFRSEDDVVLQGQRLHYVLFGSECVLVVPERKHFELEPLIEPMHYVYAGQDALFKIKRRDK